MADMRVYLRLENLQRQFAAYLATPVRGRGYVPMEGMHSLIVEIAPALAIHRVTDLALKNVPNAEPGILYVERQFGILEVHSFEAGDLEKAGAAILKGIGAKASDQLKPKILYTDIIEEVTDRHAVILNRNRDASMILPGESLVLVEMMPALFAAHAVNEAEKVAPNVTIVDIQMIGATGRVFLSGSTQDVKTACDHMVKVLEEVEGRDQ
ncbi:MAG: microcompartment protein [Alphaproteobacteria bacterium]|nr:microcompartment protein [Alphaproteobacteria bacterium]